MFDYHVHLWDHQHYSSMQATVEQLAEFCAHAQSAGIREIAITEHASRFLQIDHAVRGWWDDDPRADRRAETVASWDDELGVDLDQYVETGLAAQAAGLPVRIGMEVDYFPGHMDKVAALLDGYPFDVLLGSVHWIGAWLFDALDWTDAQTEWDKRGVEKVWEQYTRAMEELSSCGAVDVLAHPDLVKLAGRYPALPDEFNDRIAEAAAASGLCAELNSSGWQRPCAEAYPSPSLLSRFRALDVPITTASDAHDMVGVGSRIDDLVAFAASTGYDEMSRFHRRQREAVPLLRPSTEELAVEGCSTEGRP